MVWFSFGGLDGPFSRVPVRCCRWQWTIPSSSCGNFRRGSVFFKPSLKCVTEILFCLVFYFFLDFEFSKMV